MRTVNCILPVQVQPYSIIFCGYRRVSIPHVEQDNDFCLVNAAHACLVPHAEITV